jgi:Tfp pilus assembly protein PilO
MRRLSLVVMLAVVLVTVAWWFFLISPRNEKIGDLQNQHTAAIDSEQRLRVQIRQLQDIRDREVEYVSAVGRLDALIPERPHLEEFIEQVHALAGSTGVELQTLTPSLPEVIGDDTELRQITISVQVEGQFFEILGFLFGLSDMERLVRVDAVSLASSAVEGQGTLLSAGIELRLFTMTDLLPIDLPAAEDAAGTAEGTGG